MPNDNPQIVTGMREPHHTGQVAKPMNDAPQAEAIRRQTLNPGETEFHSVNKRYRVEFPVPKQKLNPVTGEVIQEGPRFMQFERYRSVTGNVDLIHQAKGCQNIPGAMIPHEHGPVCVKGCAILRCSMGHQNPKNATQLYYPKHPSCYIRGDFWDAAEMDVLMAKDAKARLIADMQKIKETIAPEDMPEFLSAVGLDSFQLPKRELPKEASK